MELTVFIIFALTALWLAAVWPGRGRRERMQTFSKQLIAHRGLHNNKGDAPENSLLAFERACENGYGIELDVRETKDGVLVVCHDDNLKRVAGLSRKISEMPLSEVRRAKLCRSEEKIPTLEEALSLIGGRVPLVLEIKSEDIRNAGHISQAVASVLDSYEGPVCMESFNPAVLKWYRKHRPEMLRGQLAEKFPNEKYPNKILMFLFSCCFFNFLTKPDFIAYKYSHANLLRFRLLHDMFHSCCAGWTIRSEEALRAAAADFDVIIFDSFTPPGDGRLVKMIRKHMLVRGTVTGVGFRYSAVNTAHMLGVTGWVKNLYDTMVEMEVQGSAAAIDEMMRRMASRRFIDISDVEEKEIPLIPDEYEFKVRY